jgi:hypothetical protein
MYFKLNKQKVIQAKIKRGLYIVYYIANSYKEAAFPIREISSYNTLIPSRYYKQANSNNKRIKYLLIASNKEIKLNMPKANFKGPASKIKTT